MAGAVVGMICGMIWWMVLPLSDMGLTAMPGYEHVTTVMQERFPGEEARAYYFPGLAEGMKGDQQAWDQVMDLHREGPVGMVFYRPSGFEPMEPGTFIRGFLINAASCLIAACLLSLAGPRIRGYAGRVLFVLSLGVLAAIMGDLVKWNWLFMPLDYTLMMMGDLLFRWLFISLCMAAIVVPGDGPATGQAAS